MNREERPQNRLFFPLTKVTWLYLCAQLLLFMGFQNNSAQGFEFRISSLILLLAIFLSLPAVQFFQNKRFAEKMKELFMEGIPLLLQYDILGFFLYFFLRQTPLESVESANWNGSFQQSITEISGVFFLLAGFQTLLVFFHSYERLKEKKSKERIIWGTLILMPAFIICTLLFYLLFFQPASGG